MKHPIPSAICSLLLILGFTTEQVHANTLDSAINGEHRSTSHKERDKYRHPRETIDFFKVQPNMAVLEVWPGGGWYTEILAPYLKKKGTFYAAHFSRHQSKPFFKKMRERYSNHFSSQPDLYGNIIIKGLYPPGNDVTPAPVNSLDRVLTFRNVHNWSKGGFDKAMFKTFFNLLKPGGILGVVEHRASAGVPFERMIQSGYMTEQYVIQLAINAGFQLDEKSEINANKADLKNYPNGVWSLPPTLRGKDKRHQEYLTIGESDRMTLRFIKPKSIPHD